MQLLVHRFISIIFLFTSFCLLFLKTAQETSSSFANSSYYFQVLRDQTCLQFLNVIFYFRLNFYTDIIINIPSKLKHPPSNPPLKLLYMKMCNNRMTTAGTGALSIYWQ